MNCLHCEKPLSGRKRLYCSTFCNNQMSNAKHQNYEAQKKRGITRKAHLIDISGGKCSDCGYKKNYAALCFHHIDSSLKSIELDIRSCSNNSMETLLNEVKKCILLCHNCHMELHNPTMDSELIHNRM